MKRNVGKSGLCGIAMAASYPIKSSPNPAPGKYVLYDHIKYYNYV